MGINNTIASEFGGGDKIYYILLVNHVRVDMFSSFGNQYLEREVDRKIMSVFGGGK